MTRWAYRISILQYLTEDESQKGMLVAAKRIRAEVKKLPNALYFRGGKEALDKIEKAAKAGELEWFNASLNSLWDFFDYHRVWVEL